ncbi:MAG: aminotransferase class IV [Flavobacteriales bacterium]|nr:aminotransferase class IV [Flavobacteriales bacterium]MCC6937419.1 aminotransferase class IV [Flavobacteriales bacterium]
MLQKYDPRNAEILVHVNGQLLKRSEAKVSVFDSVVQGGDAVWEGLRVYNGGVMMLGRHLDRLQASAHALAFANVPSNDAIRSALFETLKANGMTKDAHVRLTLTRGEKITSGMDPRLNQSGCSLIVLAEWKAVVFDNARGIRVITSSIRRMGPDVLDPKIHHNNLLNNILAKLEANVAGVDGALMLDRNGHVAELNDINVFAIINGEVVTPYTTSCLGGITRALVLELCMKNGIPCRERDLSVVELMNADAVFGTGTMGELTPITELDGRKVGKPAGEPVMKRLQEIFRAAVPGLCERIV